VPLAAGTRFGAYEIVALIGAGEPLSDIMAGGGKRQLFLRTFGAAEGRPVDGSDGATTALFSNDSKWIAFDRGAALEVGRARAQTAA